MLKDAWTLAIETLSWIELKKISEHMAFTTTIKQLKIKDANSLRLGYCLAVETVRRKNIIDKFINSCLKEKKLDEFDMGIQAFLRLYVYKTRVVKNWIKPDLNEAISIAKLGRTILSWETLREVEYVLGFLLTKQVQVILDSTKDDEKVALQTFHPTWFVKYCFELFGKEQAIAFLDGNMQAPPTYIRLNTLKGTEEELLYKIASDGVHVEKVDQLQYTYKIIDSKRPLSKTAGFQQGLFYSQDKASCFAAQVANPQPGSTVLDICAAPGAKTTFLAQLMKNQGTLCSLDFSRRRINSWKEEVRHMGATIADAVIADATVPFPFSVKADVVILDPPCTSTGVFAKLPAAKWRLTLHSMKKMAELQHNMINNAADNVVNGGTLIYSTCSITIEENENIIETFLKTHPEFTLVDIEPKIGTIGLKGLDKCQRLYPHLHQCNGFFIAKLQKK
ncbi:MAG: NOL1/NOP2/sun family putative RNA methylase [Crenarchaeota archaeon]|nr:NOL1/NOP2/sun family putative RNA methylase [Thermoproteota archaeon]